MAMQDVQVLAGAVCAADIDAAAAVNGVAAKCAVCADVQQLWRA